VGKVALPLEKKVGSLKIVLSPDGSIEGTVENQGLSPTFEWRRNLQSFKGAGASIENTTIKLYFNRNQKWPLTLAIVRHLHGSPSG
jgi:hypothetical protein